jgi:hypothetical protein
LAEYPGPDLLGWCKVDSIEPRPIHGWEQTQSHPLLQFRQDLFGSYQRRKGGAKQARLPDLGKVIQNCRIDDTEKSRNLTHLWKRPRSLNLGPCVFQSGWPEVQWNAEAQETILQLKAGEAQKLSGLTQADLTSQIGSQAPYVWIVRLLTQILLFNSALG